MRTGKSAKRPSAGQRVLLSFVGSHDPYRGGDPTTGDGPLLKLLTHESFAVIHLFYNTQEYLRRAGAVYEELHRRAPDTRVAYVEIPVTDPTDHEALYDLMQHHCLEILREHADKADYCVATSSGTPQMQTCWLLLVLGGVLPDLVLSLWGDLGGANGLQAYSAFCRLRAEPAAALALIRKQLIPKEDQRIARLIDDLDDDRFAVRQKATDQLAGLGLGAESALRKVLENKPSLEVRQRIERLLQRIQGPTGERRTRWAIRLVELAGGRESRQLLQDLAGGAADSVVTKEAKAALERLPK